MLAGGLADLHKVPEVSGLLDLLSPFEEQKQKRAFVQQNHMFRIGNEPDDGTRMNGYRLYYMRFMVSVTPSAKTRLDHSAEVMLTPTYPLAEASRDWVAQYVRGMLRERIMRVVEFGFERAIARRLKHYGESTLSWHELQEASRLVELVESEIDRAHGFVKAHECEKASTVFKHVRETVSRLRNYVRGDACARELDALLAAATAYENECQLVKAALAHQDRVDLRKADLYARALTEHPTFAQELMAGRVDGLAEGAKSLPGDQEKRILQLIEEQANLAREEKRATEAAVEAKTQVAEKWDALKSIKVALQNVLGAQQDQDAAAYSHDVGTKLRNEYLGLIRLAQLAYDELAREADVLLRVPNAVKLDGDNSARLTRAKNALCDLLAGRSIAAERPDRPDGDSCPSGTPSSQLSDLIDPDLHRIDIHDFTTQALNELADRVDRYRSPTAAFKELYAPSLARVQQRTSSLGKESESVALRADADELRELIGISFPDKRPVVAGTNKLDKRQLRGFFSTDNWPIYTFAVAPFSEAENIGRAIDLNNEVQVRLNAALKLSELGKIDGALEYARAVREQLRAVQVNRTVVGLVRGEQNFGWQFNPPYGLPVKVRHGGKYVRTGYHDVMPSQTHEVFALVAVPGFLRSMDFGVHYDWTAVQQSDAGVIGTNKAAKYLREFRGVDSTLSRRTSLPGTNTEDAFFFGELYQQRLELVESSLPLRMMRRVFLPYADVSERMTNTAGVSNLLPRITRVVPRYVPSEQAVVVTIEGHNFDTGRIDVMIGGQAATEVEILNEKAIAATVPARGIIADLTVVKRDGGLFNEAKETATGKKLLHDLEGIVEVIVVTPAGLASDVALLRITKPVDETKEPGITGSIPDGSVIVAHSLWDQSGLKISLADSVKETSGTLVLKSDSSIIDLPVMIGGRELTVRDPIGGTAQGVLAALIDKEVSNAILYPRGGHPSGIAIKGKLKVEKLTAKAVEKLTVESAGAPATDRVKETALEVTFTRPVKIKSGRVVVTAGSATPGGPSRIQPIELTDLSGSKINVPMNEEARKVLGGWLGASQSLELVLTLESAQRDANSTPEKMDLGVTRLTK